MLLVRSSIHLNAVIRKSMQHRIECVLMHSTSSEEDGARMREREQCRSVRFTGVGRSTVQWIEIGKGALRCLQ